MAIFSDRGSTPLISTRIFVTSPPQLVQFFGLKIGEINRKRLMILRSLVAFLCFFRYDFVVFGVITLSDEGCSIENNFSTILKHKNLFNEGFDYSAS